MGQKLWEALFTEITGESYALIKVKINPNKQAQ